MPDLKDNLGSDAVTRTSARTTSSLSSPDASEPNRNADCRIFKSALFVISCMFEFESTF